jgi:hypothetical protein
MIARASTFLGPNGLFQSGGTPSLVLSLDTNNALSYNGLAAETWTDLSIRHNNGKLNNVIAEFNGTPQTALSFGGTSSYISFTQSDGIPIGDQPYTIEVWFNSNSYGPSEQGSLVGWGTTGVDNASNVLRLDTNGITNYWWNNDVSIGLSGTSSMIVGNWYYAVASYDGSVRKLYLNGKSIGGDTPTAPHNVTDSRTLQIGYFYTNYFNGKISKVKISDRALSDAKILNNFNNDKISHGYLFGSMTFDETQKSSAYSSSTDYAFGTNDFTIEAYFSASQSSNIGDSSFGGIISLRGNSAYQDGVDINLSQTNTTTPHIEFSAGGDYISTYTASNDKWYHVAISRNSGTSSFYINGNLFTQFTDNVNYSNNNLVIGRYYTDLDDRYFNGVISNVRVTNGTGLYTSNFSVPSAQLSSLPDTKLLITSQQTTPKADVSGLLHTVNSQYIGWTSSLPVLYVTDGLICYLDGNNYTSGSTWYDLSGNGNNATLYNGYSYNDTNGGVVRFDGEQYSRGEINLDLSTTPCTIIYGTRYLQNVGAGAPSGRCLGGTLNNWLLGTWANKVNQFYSDDSQFISGGNPGDPTDMNWHIYAGSIVGPIKFFNNGTKLVDTSAGGNGPNGITLGSDFLHESANCDISFVLVYDRTLSDDEILTNFNYFRGRLGL